MLLPESFMRLKVSVLVAALAAPLSVIAGPNGVSETGLQYNTISADYSMIDIDDSDIDATGIAFTFSHLLNDHLFLIGQYGWSETDRFDSGANASTIETTALTLGLGARTAIASNVDLVGRAAFLRLRAKGTGELAGLRDFDSGLRLQVGLRALLTAALEVEAAVAYVNIFDESETSVGGTARYHVTNRFSGALTAEFSSDATALGFGVRYAY
jgi:hypothetical protein